MKFSLYLCKTGILYLQRQNELQNAKGLLSTSITSPAITG